jgi:3-oxoacyl-[acyl-carrier-protein] synthase II
VLAALSQAGASVTDVEHVNAHATSTPVGDIAEYTAIKRVFGDHTGELIVSATKAATGHLLGGAGAIEAIFTILALKEQLAPPTINLDNQDPAIELNVPRVPTKLSRPNAVAISNSFGFGGHNAVLAFRNL